MVAYFLFVRVALGPVAKALVFFCNWARGRQIHGDLNIAVAHGYGGVISGQQRSSNGVVELAILAGSFDLDDTETLRAVTL